MFSIGRIAWLVLALQSGNVNNLRAGCEDKMHQPQRAKQDAYKHVRGDIGSLWEQNMSYLESRTSLLWTVMLIVNVALFEYPESKYDLESEFVSVVRRMQGRKSTHLSIEPRSSENTGQLLPL